MSRAGCLCQALCAKVGLHRLILCQALCAKVGLDACVRPCVLESGWMPVSGPVC
ncbi:hypothetical protein DPMN_094283 [Dreissena polymorpha]|uniref:Uncharacterized protein n=1 Tax=Dreissena polymorpha TaxID=45954 RepID=A0A9D4L4H5_DREPO|nr:hypothetical protein DPMN_094283 [Dreissena polymorpha]